MNAVSPSDAEFRVQFGNGTPEAVTAASPSRAARLVRNRVCDASTPRHVNGIPIVVRLADPKALGYWLFMGTMSGIRFAQGRGVGAESRDDDGDGA